MILIGLLLLEFFFMHFFLIAGNQFQPDSICFVMIVVYSMVYIFEISQSEKYSIYMRELLCGYLLRVFLLLFDIYGKSIYQLPNSGADSVVFYKSAQLYAGVSINANKMGSFPYVMGLVFKFIGVNQLYGQFLMLLCSMVAIHFFLAILDLLKIDYKIKKRTLLIVCLLPNFAILSVIFLREAIVTMLITISLCFFLKWFLDKSFLFLILSVLACVCACYFHSGSIGLIVGYIIILFLYSSYKERFTLSALNIIIATVIAVIMGFLFLNYSDSLFSKLAKVDDISDIANTLDYGGSSYARYVGNSSSISNMVIFTIPRIIYFLFSPFPWQWRGLSDIIAFCFSSLFYFAATRSALGNLRFMSRKNKDQTIAIIIISISIVFVFAWGVSNTGTAARHRDKIVMLFSVLYALGMNGSIERNVRSGMRQEA